MSFFARATKSCPFRFQTPQDHTGVNTMTMQFDPNERGKKLFASYVPSRRQPFKTYDKSGPARGSIMYSNSGYFPRGGIVYESWKLRTRDRKLVHQQCLKEKYVIE